MSTILKKSHWNWINIAMYVIEIIVVISVIKFLMQFFGGTGGVGAGIASVFGAGANFINGISDGCSKQQDCSEGKASLKDCKAIMNCSFRQITVPVVPGTGPAPGPGPGAGTGLVNTCVSTNGTPTGGGISTLGCLFGIGAILAAFTAVIASILFPFLKLFGKSASKGIQVVVKRRGTDITAGETREVFRDTNSCIEAWESSYSNDASGDAARKAYKDMLENGGEKEIAEAYASSWTDAMLVRVNASVAERSDQMYQTDSYMDVIRGKFSDFADWFQTKLPTEEVDPPVDMIRKALVPDNDFVINDVFKTYLKKHINRLGLSLNTTEQAVLEGKYNDQSEIKDNIDSVITTVFSSN